MAEIITGFTLLEQEEESEEMRIIPVFTEELNVISEEKAPEAKSSSPEGYLKFDTLLSCSADGLHQMFEASDEVLSEDWVKFSCFRQQPQGLSASLIGSIEYKLVYNNGWSDLAVQSQLSSMLIRRKMKGNILLSSRSTYKLLGLTCGCHVDGLDPDCQYVQSQHQESDLVYSLPLRFNRTARGFLTYRGSILQPGIRFFSMLLSSFERVSSCGSSSPASILSRPRTLLKFNPRKLGPEPRKQTTADSGKGNSVSSRRDVLGAWRGIFRLHSIISRLHIEGLISSKLS